MCACNMPPWGNISYVLKSHDYMNYLLVGGVGGGEEEKSTVQYKVCIPSYSTNTCNSSNIFTCIYIYIKGIHKVLEKLLYIYIYIV